ncbi:MULTISPECIES: hypothetical protein [Burkholderiaceae]|uniref:hypothetical protein n=1 Tax=Burkholderiaceae TaxID=119060 RepID=UPI000976FF18|nr:MULTISPECIES: hypothetical protein [Burkholderiaceae]MCG1018961.1 hypothetical protein [Mycetohabitans sp. B4]
MYRKLRETLAGARRRAAGQSCRCGAYQTDVTGRPSVPAIGENPCSRNYLNDAATDREDLKGSVAVDFLARRVRLLRHPLRLAR